MAVAVVVQRAFDSFRKVFELDLVSCGLNNANYVSDRGWLALRTRQYTQPIATEDLR